VEPEPELQRDMAMGYDGSDFKPDVQHERINKIVIISFFVLFLSEFIPI
jgi:hypothetical protein